MTKNHQSIFGIGLYLCHFKISSLISISYDKKINKSSELAFTGRIEEEILEEKTHQVIYMQRIYIYCEVIKG